MPLDVRFEKVFDVPDPDDYYNEVCFGGDVVSDRLLPAIRSRYTVLQADQEDWGWFIWLRDGRVRLAVDITCEDRARGSFRLRLTSSVKKWFVWDRVVDTPELDRLRELVERELADWSPRSSPSP